MKKVKQYYYSVEWAHNDEADELRKSNPEKAKAKAYAKKIGGVMRSRYVPEDDGYMYTVYK